MNWVYNDGGREAAGFKGATRDCACRAIAIGTGIDYRSTYDLLIQASKLERPSKTRRGSSHPRTGVHTVTMRKVLADLGWDWTPTMAIGSGCRVHVDADELPSGVLILNLSRHFSTVIDGVIHDTHDPSRDGTRCVYGYWSQP